MFILEVKADIFLLLCADAVIEQANWDTSKTRSKLIRDLDEYIASVRDAKLAELTSSYEVRIFA